MCLKAVMWELDAAYSVLFWKSRDVGRWKTGKPDRPQLLEVEANWEFCRVGPLGPLPSPRTPRNQTHEKIVGVFSLEVIYFTTKINIFPRFHNFQDGKGEGKRRHVQRVNWKNTGWTLDKHLPE